MACHCQKCKNFIHGSHRMIMLKEELWLSIANKKDILCDECIVKILKRPLVYSDFKLSEDLEIPCNMIWLELNKNNKKLFKDDITSI